MTATRFSPRCPGVPPVSERAVVATFAAVVTRNPGESDADLLDRVETAMYAMVQHSPFSGFEGVRFYPGNVKFDKGGRSGE